MVDLQGRTIGEFQLVELISESDKNLIYRGFQPAMNRYVAVKVLSPARARDQTVVQQFRQEIQLIAGLEHRNILPVYGYGEADGLPYLATRYIEGATLKERLAQFQSPARAQQLISPMADALGYVHSQGIVHGNLKPSNVLIDEERQPLLTDFGAFQNMGMLGQDNPYQSPEQAQVGQVDRRTDIYALGALLYEMIIGEPPEAGVVPSPRLKRPDVSPEVEQVILKAMAYDPNQRFQTAADFSRALTVAVGEPSPPAVAPVPPPAAPASQQDNKQLWWIVGGLVAAAMIAAIICGLAMFLGLFSSGDGDEGSGLIVIIPTPAPAEPSVTASRDTDIRTGPADIYDVVGVLQQGQSAEAIGRSGDNNWWVINVPAVAGGQGWVAAVDVTAENTENLPIIQPPPPPTPSPTPDQSQPQPPVADINGPAEAQVGVSVTFSARDSTAAEGSRLVGFDWQFGDGAGSSGIDVTHTYESSGDYEVTLTVTDDQALTDSDVQLIRIVDEPPTPAPDEPPTAVISGPSEGAVGDPVTLDASQSQCANQCVSFAWELGDGSTANAINVTHIYDSPALYNVILTITDDKGLQSTTNTQLRIEESEVPPPEPTDEPQPPNGSETEQ
jgi:PKD repeat protein